MDDDDGAAAYANELDQRRRREDLQDALLKRSRDVLQPELEQMLQDLETQLGLRKRA